MTKFGFYKFILELIMTSILVTFFPFLPILKIKLVILYVIVQFLVGRYNHQSLTIWNEFKPMLISYVGYFICSLLLMRTGLGDHNIHWGLIGCLVLYNVCHLILSLVITRYTHLIFWNSLKHNVLIIGIGPTAAALENVCRQNRFSLLNVVGMIDCNNDPYLSKIRQEKSPDIKHPVYPYAQLEELIKKENVDTVLIAIPQLSRHDLKKIKEKILDKVVNIKYLPHIDGLVTFDTKIDDFDGMLMISTSEGSITLLERFIKRLIDILGACVGMIALVPLQLCVRHLNHKQGDYGPIMYTQQRIGKDGKLFTIYKYRTMVENADQILEELMEKDPAIREEYIINKKLQHDPRVTKAGEFLRKTSLDEFPQFINVFKGEMSLIGPRPYLPREIPDMGDYYKDIIQSKPGLTGMWQTHGRSDVTFEERLELDEYYAHNWSLWLDLTLLVRTVKTVLGRKSAV